jgi:hypothetical protein
MLYRPLPIHIPPCILQIARIGDIYKVNNTSRPRPNSSPGGSLIDWEIITETGGKAWGRIGRNLKGHFQEIYKFCIMYHSPPSSLQHLQ